MDNSTKATANHSKRTFTIRTKNAKYRTHVFTKQEFDELDNNTLSDWKYFLRSQDFYYLINK